MMISAYISSLEAVHSHKVYGFDYDGYWRDIGTIRAFYDVNMEMTLPHSPFSFYDPKLPIYTHARFLPGSVVHDSHLTDVLLTEGCRIENAAIVHSVVGLRTRIATGTHIQDCILMGSDYYSPDIGIGPNCDIQGAILDKNVRVGRRRRHPPLPTRHGVR